MSSRSIDVVHHSIQYLLVHLGQLPLLFKHLLTLVLTSQTELISLLIIFYATVTSETPRRLAVSSVNRRFSY